MFFFKNVIASYSKNTITYSFYYNYCLTNKSGTPAQKIELIKEKVTIKSLFK